MIDGAYGSRLARAFRLAYSPVLISENQKGVRLAATEIRVDSPASGLTDPIFSDNAYLIGLQLRSLNHYEVWLRCGFSCSAPIYAGSSSLHDLAHGPALYFGEPLHAIYFYVPRASFDDLDDGVSRVSRELNIRPGQIVDDAIIRNIGQTITPYFDRIGQNSHLVTDYLLLALSSHLLTTYGGARRSTANKRFGLAPWQQRTATELMNQHLAEGISLAQISEACRLSQSAFVRAFKKSMSVTPHQWLLSRRIERAVELMDVDTLSLVDVALATGFADQSHFTRIFMKKMGVSPGAYRRARCA